MIRELRNIKKEEIVVVKEKKKRGRNLKRVERIKSCKRVSSK
jgi:hypothetical protein